MNSVRNIHLPIRLRNFKKLAQFGEFLSRTVPCRGITNCLVFRGGIGQLKRQGRCTLSSSLILNSDVRVMLTIPMTRSSALHARSYATEQRSKNSPRRYYDVLEISPKANQAQIKAAYFRLSKLYHPDINKSKDAVEKFAEISEAHEILSKATTRKMYDRGIIDPRDPRSTHRSTHYWNSQTGQATREGAQNKPRRPPPTGKTPVYDYDEWLRTRFGQAGFHNYGLFGVGSKVTYQQCRGFWKNRDEDAEHSLRHREPITTKGEFLAVVIIAGLAASALFSITGIPRPPKMDEDKSELEKRQEK